MLERNAPGFHYRVVYYPASNTSVGNVTVHIIRDWRERRLVIDSSDFGIYQSYIFYVQAVNDEGEAPIGFLEKKMGYSGQDGKWVRVRMCVRVKDKMVSCSNSRQGK